MSHTPSLALAALLLWAVPAAAQEAWLPPPPAELPEGYTLVDRIVALVDTSLVTDYEVREAARVNVMLRGADPETSEITGDAELRTALDALVDEILVLSAAEELDLAASDADVESYLGRVRAQNGWSEEDLARNVKMQGFDTVDGFRAVVRKEIMKSKVFSYKVGSRVNVGMADVERVLEAEYAGGAKQRQVRVSVILRKLRPGASAEDTAEAQRTATWIHQQADAAPELFEDLARKYSEDDGTRFDGGDIGWIAKGTLAVAELEDEAFDTPVGEVGPIVTTEVGTFIFKITDTREAQVANVEALKDEIYQRLRDEAQAKAYKSWIEELRATRYVEYRLDR
jgi:parvulin-like peptidyl-prolyl isomerase